MDTRTRVAVMARAALFPTSMLDSFLGEPDPYRRLAQLQAHSLFLEALTIASPTLAEELQALEPTWPTKRFQGLTLSLLRYLLRATTRCTPFGLFAGVKALPLGDHTRLTLHPHHRKTLRVDAEQVLDLVRQAEEQDDLRDDLLVYANPTLYQIGERLRLPYQDTYGQSRHTAQLSLRSTPVVRRILHLTQQPRLLRDVLDQLQAEYADAPRHHIRQFTLKLFEQQVLLSRLRPPMTEADPLRYVARQLPTHPCSEELQTHLHRALHLTEQYNQSPLGGGIPTLQALLAHLKFTSGQTQRHVQVDTQLDAEGTFSEGDVQELQAALQAASVWFESAGNPALEQYLQEFLERYGNREVPLLELLDPQYGLGAPAGYASPASTRSIQSAQAQHRQFELLQRAAGQRELDLQGLAAPQSATSLAWPDSADIFLSRTAGTVSDPQLIIEGIHSPGGGTFGRFTHIDTDLRDHLQREAQRDEAQPNCLTADLMYAESTGHANNVAIHAPVYRVQTTVACTPADPAQHLPLNDVMVGVSQGLFYLRSRQQGVQLRFRTPHVLNPLMAPNVVRFLQEVSNMHAPELPYWSWGDAEHLDFLPRLRYGRVILARARWRLRPETLAAADFSGALQAERQERGVPRFVYAGVADNRLLLDLDSPLCLELLRSVVHKDSPVLTEALMDYHSQEGLSAQGRHAVQYVVSLPLPGRNAPQIAPRLLDTPDEQARWVLPFQGGLYFKLYGPPDLQDDVLSAFQAQVHLHAPNLPWFYVRYVDSGHHLRWRAFGEGPAFDAAMQQLLSEAKLLHGRGLLTRVELGSYERELERYGGVAGMHLNERIFCADSVWQAARLSHGLPAPADRLAHVGASTDALLHALGFSAPQRQWVLEQACAGYREEFGPHAMPAEQLERILKNDLRQHRAALWEALGQCYPARSGATVPPELAHFRREVAPLRASLHALVRIQDDPEAAQQLLSSLTHMHANRAQLDRFQEFRALHLLLKSHQGFAHHFPPSIDAQVFQAAQPQEMNA